MKKEVSLHAKQFEAITTDKQYTACIAGVRGGKTFVGAYWTAKQIEEQDGDGIIAAPTYKMLQQATLPTFFRELPYYRQFYKEQKGIIELPNKNIYIRSADNPFSMEGITARWAWLDEAGLMPLLAWTVIRSRTSLHRGKVFITTTPYNMGWLYQDFYLPWKQGNDNDLKVITWASVDNPYFPPDFFEKERKRLSKEEFQKRYLGEFSRMQGLVYELHNWHTVEDMPANFEAVIGGVDWGFTNPAALSVIGIRDGRYYILDEWYEVGKTTPEIIEAMKNLQDRWQIRRWYADSANPEKIQEANHNTGLYVIPFEKKKDSITAGVSRIQQLFRENLIQIHKRCKNALIELESYHYPERVDGDLAKEEPYPENNHYMDAMRYAICGFSPANYFPQAPKLVFAKNKVSHLLSTPMTKKIDGTSYK